MYKLLCDSIEQTEQLPLVLLSNWTQCFPVNVFQKLSNSFYTLSICYLNLGQLTWQKEILAYHKIYIEFILKK